MHKSLPPAATLLHWAEEPALPAAKRISLSVKCVTKCMNKIQTSVSLTDQNTFVSVLIVDY